MCINYVEVGWYEDPQGIIQCLDATGGPVNELAFSIKGNMLGCLHNPGNISEGTDTFTVKDPDGDAQWSYGHAGSTIWTSPDLGNFNSGALFHQR
jgi:hypothetical protein